MNSKDKLITCYQKDDTLRLRIDYHSINNNTAVNQYQLPRIYDIFNDHLGVSMVYRKLYLATGYHQLAKETNTHL